MSHIESFGVKNQALVTNQFLRLVKVKFGTTLILSQSPIIFAPGAEERAEQRGDGL